MSTRVHQPPTLTFASANWEEACHELPPAEQLSARGTGEVVVNHRSSWVRKVSNRSVHVFVKTYEYATWIDRIRNWGKWTAPLRASRAARECFALTWLRANGFEAPLPLACYEWRRLGFLCKAMLLTQAFDGQAADQLLASSSVVKRKSIAAAIGSFVAALHEKGFRDRNLDLRNLLIRVDGTHITVAKIDSPRHRIVKPGQPRDSLAEADWRRLLPQLATFEVAPEALAAKTRGIA